MKAIDLRSDTVTKPSAAMRQAMANAEVGDDCYRDDPTVLRLEERAAELLGQESALFVPTGTMANQLALMLHTKPGDAVVIGEHAHLSLYEAGAASAFAGVQFSVAGRGGLFSADDFKDAISPDNYNYAPTKLVCLENTHNHAGGRVFEPDAVAAIASSAREKNIRLHIDGARIWNAAAARDLPVSTWTSHADTVSVAFSKCLGAPVGSVLAGSKDVMTEAMRIRRRLGGALRQVGIVAAGALFALEHHMKDVCAANEMASQFASILRDAQVDLIEPETNLVIFQCDGAQSKVLQESEAAGVRMGAFGAGRIRAAFHRDVTLEESKYAAEIVAKLMTL